MYDQLHTTDQFRTALDRHTLHHPEDERHPLYELAVSLLELAQSLEDDPWEAEPEAPAAPPPPEPEPATPGTELRCIDMPAGTTCYTYHHNERHGHHIKPSAPLKQNTWVTKLVLFAILTSLVDTRQLHRAALRIFVGVAISSAVVNPSARAAFSHNDTMSRPMPLRAWRGCVYMARMRAAS